MPLCGRFTFQPTEAFYERFKIRHRLDALLPRYNIAPGQMVPVIIANSPRRMVLMRWGLIPHWAKDQKTAYKMINMRVETLTQRRAPGPVEPPPLSGTGQRILRVEGRGAGQNAVLHPSAGRTVLRVCRPLRCVDQCTRRGSLRVHHHHDSIRCLHGEAPPPDARRLGEGSGGRLARYRDDEHEGGPGHPRQKRWP